MSETNPGPASAGERPGDGVRGRNPRKARSQATVPGFRDDVAGWLTEDQAAMLAAAAAVVAPGGTIVEIGSFQGRSTLVLAAAAPTAAVVAIDPHAGNDRGPQEIDGYVDEAAADRVAFVRNLERAGVRGRVRHVPAFSADAHAEVPGSIDLLYIDGAHRYAPARADVRNWGAKVAAGGAMLIHDSFSSLGVTMAIARELLFGGRFRFVGRSRSLALVPRRPAGRALGTGDERRPPVLAARLVRPQRRAQGAAQRRVRPRAGAGRLAAPLNGRTDAWAEPVIELRRRRRPGTAERLGSGERHRRHRPAPGVQRS